VLRSQGSMLGVGDSAKDVLDLDMPLAVLNILRDMFYVCDINKHKWLNEEEVTRIKLLMPDAAEVIEDAKNASGRVYLLAWLKSWDKTRHWDEMSPSQIREMLGTFGSMKRTLASKSIPDLHKVLLEMFAILDITSSGNITHREFKYARAYFPLQSGELRFPSNGDLAVYFDTDDDEVVDRKEWVRGFCKLGRWNTLSSMQIDMLYCKFKVTVDMLRAARDEREALLPESELAKLHNARICVPSCDPGDCVMS